MEGQGRGVSHHSRPSLQWEEGAPSPGTGAALAAGGGTKSSVPLSPREEWSPS